MVLDVRRLQSFSAVARRLSFVRAASELRITQPALTRQIQSLEADLGVQLFERDRRGTALTPAGDELLRGTDDLLFSLTELERRVRATARGERHFVVGFMPGVPTTELVRAFAAATPGLVVESVYTRMIDQEDYLRDGRVDVCFVRLPVVDPEIQVIPVLEEPRVAAFAASSPLAGTESITLDELRMLPLIDDPSALPEWSGDVLSRREPFATIEDRLESVASGAGFTILPEGIAEFYRRDDVSVAIVTDLAPVTVALGHVRSRAIPELSRFAALVQAHLGSRS